jgi:hypothetical protein
MACWFLALHVFAPLYKKLLSQLHYSDIPGETEQQMAHSSKYYTLSF